MEAMLRKAEVETRLAGADVDRYDRETSAD
jgi:hypothetical protein